MWLQVGVIMLLLGLSGLLWAEWKRLPVLRWISKPCASVGFLFIAMEGFPFAGFGHIWIVGGLVLGAGGDLFLLGNGKRSFLCGLTLFLLGHVAFALAFAMASKSWLQLWLPTLVISALLFAVVRWAWPHLGKMKVAVAAYTAVIGTMLIFAYSEQIPILWTMAATLFAISDFFVLRQRFVHATSQNRFLGLPLYYAAQALFAASLHP